MYVDKYEKTPLHWAAVYDRKEIVEALINAKAKVDAQDKRGETPFDLTTNEEIKTLLQNAEKTDPVDESSTDSEGSQGEAEGVEAVAPTEPAQTEEQPSSFFGSLFSILM